MPVRFWQEIQALLRRRDDTLASYLVNNIVDFPSSAGVC